MALQLAHRFNFQTHVRNRGERKKREQVRFVSMLVNPFCIRFPSSRSALDRVFPAHSPRKALGTCLLGRHRFIWGITTTPPWKNEPYSCGLQHKRVRRY